MNELTTKANSNNKSKEGVEYVGVNEGRDMWEINYDEGAAQHIGQRVTLDDLKLNHREHLYRQIDYAISDYIEEQGYEVIKFTEGMCAFKDKEPELIYMECVECGSKVSTTRGHEPWNCANPDCGGGMQKITLQQYNSPEATEFGADSEGDGDDYDPIREHGAHEPLGRAGL